MKDWLKSGLKVETKDPLPDYNGKFLTAVELLEKISNKNSPSCFKDETTPNVTILDLRTEHHLNNQKRPSIIKTKCPYIFSLLDDLQKPEVRNLIPKTGLVVTITETGNRDKFAMQYLLKYGYENIYGLLFGMRGWIKAGFETTFPEKAKLK